MSQITAASAAQVPNAQPANPGSVQAPAGSAGPQQGPNVGGGQASPQPEQSAAPVASGYQSVQAISTGAPGVQSAQSVQPQFSAQAATSMAAASGARPTMSGAGTSVAQAPQASQTKYTGGSVKTGRSGLEVVIAVVVGFVLMFV